MAQGRATSKYRVPALALDRLQLLARRKDGWFRAFDYDLLGPRTGLVELIERTDNAYPLLEVGRPKAWLVAEVRGRPDALVADADAGIQSLAELSTHDREQVAAAAQTRRCLCFLCQKLRARLK